MKKKSRSIKLQITLTMLAITLVTAVVLMATSLLEINRLGTETIEVYTDAALGGYKTEIKSEVQTAITVIQGYYDQYQAGVYTEEEAQELAKEAVRIMRYRDDGSGYFWIDGTDYTLVMHPILPDNEGTNRYELEDQNGVMIIQDIMKSAEAGGGYNEFYFTKADGVTVAPKLAYSEPFTPWNWVVTTGNYMDDIEAQELTIRETIQSDTHGITSFMMIETVILYILCIIVALLMSARFANNIIKVKKNLDQIAEGNLQFEVDKKALAMNNEIGEMAHSLNNVKSELTEVIGLVAKSAEDVNSKSQDFNESFASLASNITSVNIAAEDIAKGATAQSSDADRVSSKVEELDQIITEENNMVKRLDEVAAILRSSMETTAASVQSLMEISKTTSSAVEFVQEQTNKTNESVSNIQDAVGLISDIASQTNLLSLNASIEAARAGEQGKGFAVVADEIRKLADMSAESATDIERSVHELADDSEKSMEQVRGVVSNLKNQNQVLDETIVMFQNLQKEIEKVEAATASISEQTSALNDVRIAVTDSITDLAAVTEENAASTEETSASMQVFTETVDEYQKKIAELMSLSEQLKQQAEHFEL